MEKHIRMIACCLPIFVGSHSIRASLASASISLTVKSVRNVVMSCASQAIMLKETLQRNSLPLLTRGRNLGLATKSRGGSDRVSTPSTRAVTRRPGFGHSSTNRLPLVLRALSAKAVPALLPYVRKLQPVLQRRGNRVMNFAPLYEHSCR